MRAWVMFILLSTVACGDEVGIGLNAVVRLDALLADEVTTLNLYAFGQWRKDGVMLTCGTLVLGDVEPTDKQLDLLDRAVVAVNGGTGTGKLDEVAAGPNRVVYVEGEDAGGTVIAAGCTDGVRVKEGETATIEVDVFPVQ